MWYLYYFKYYIYASRNVEQSWLKYFISLLLSGILNRRLRDKSVRQREYV